MDREYTQENLGLKAAVRAHHITLRGVDVEIEKMVRGVPAMNIPVRDKGPVTGSLTGSLNPFIVSQALTWLAGGRGEIQETGLEKPGFSNGYGTSAKTRAITIACFLSAEACQGSPSPERINP